jgi:hypothetical protein
MKIRPVEPDCSLRADMTNLIIAFRNSETAANSGKIVYCHRFAYSPSIVEVYIEFCNKYLCLTVFNV